MAVSKYDQEYLSTDQQGQIDALTKAAEAGSMDWNTAHSLAEGIRSQAAGGGYIGGDDGSGYNSLYSGNGIVGTGSGAGTGAGSGAGAGAANYDNDTDYAAKAMALYASGDIDGAYDTLFGSSNSRNAKIAGIGTDYGQSSKSIWDNMVAQYGSKNADLDALKAQISSLIEQISTPASYSGGWGDDTYKALLQQAIDMNYDDWAQGDQYQALADRYGYQGKLSMQDVLGQIASRTGGLASSYATTAAQQQYNDYMAQLESAARSAFSGERNNIIENAGLARDYSDQQYSRYIDQVNQNMQSQGYALDSINQLLDYAYQDDANNYARNQTGKADAQNRIYDYLVNQGGSVGDLDASLITTSGYTTAELNAMESKYKANSAAASSEKYNVTSAEKPKLTAEQTMSAIKGGILNDTTKSAYEYYYGQPYDTEESKTEDEPTVDTADVIGLGYGPISGEFLASLEDSGKITSYIENGKIRFKKN